MSITLDGTSGITTPAETVQGPLTTTGNTILGDASTDTLNVGNGGLVKDASGNVGIGTASPTQPLDVNGNVAITGTGRRITGDMSNATHVNRVAFQSSVVNGATSPFIIPNGTGNVASVVVANSSDAANCSYGQIVSNGIIDVRIVSGQLGTGTYLPLTFYTGGSERARIDTSGNVGIGNTAPADRLQIEKANANCLLSVSRTTGGAGGRLVMQHTDSVGALQTTASVPLCFGTNDTERMRIDSSGNVTMPYQPAFNAYASGSLSGSQSPVVFNSVRLNRGSGYSTSTGRFTAPVAGAYFFSVTNNVLGASSNDGLIRKNGIAIIGVEYDVAQGGAWLGLTATTIIDLAIGDYVDFTMGGGTWSVEGTPWNNFVGHLIG